MNTARATCGSCRRVDSPVSRARALGYERARLDTGDRQPEALGLFRSAGYAAGPAHDDNPFAHYRMEKRITPGR